MSRPILLWTERPVLLERELETHAWMEEHRPWEKFDLELIHDTSPGDWRHYSIAFHDAWRRARAENVAFLNLESDIVPTEEAFRSLLACQEYACTVPYVIHNYETGQGAGHSAVIEQRYRGGWESHFARVGEERAVQCDLGLVRYSSGLTPLNFDEVPQLEFDNGLLHEAVAAWLRFRLRRPDPIHLHWPAVKNNHHFWDDGDQAHHPAGFVPVPGMLGKRP